MDSLGIYPASRSPNLEPWPSYRDLHPGGSTSPISHIHFQLAVWLEAVKTSLMLFVENEREGLASQIHLVRHIMVTYKQSQNTKREQMSYRGWREIPRAFEMPENG